MNIIIRPAVPEELAACADIWLESSLVAHDFITPQFWQANREAMEREYLPVSDVFAAMSSETGMAGIIGFSAIHGHTLAALFVRPALQKRGIGTALLAHTQSLHSRLELAVYEKNTNARGFYLRHGFQPVRSGTCAHTGEQEIIMEWKS